MLDNFQEKHKRAPTGTSPIGVTAVPTQSDCQEEIPKLRGIRTPIRGGPMGDKVNQGANVAITVYSGASQCADNTTVYSAFASYGQPFTFPQGAEYFKLTRDLGADEQLDFFTYAIGGQYINGADPKCSRLVETSHPNTNGDFLKNGPCYYLWGMKPQARDDLYTHRVLAY